MAYPVAQEILRQLGGAEFTLMTGACNLCADANSLRLSLTDAKDGINKVHIVLEPSDTYTVRFYRIRGANMLLVSEHTDMYFDQLQDLFEQCTGLLVTLHPRR